MKYKLLILDVDGTLVESSEDAKLSEGVKNAIRKISKSVSVSLCTGRSLEHAKGIIRELGIDNSYHVLESGSKVVNPDGAIEYSKFLSQDDIKQIIGLAGDIPSGIGFCIDGIWKNDIIATAKGKTTIVTLHSDSKSKTEKLLLKIKPLNSYFNCHVGSSWFSKEGAMIHITNREANKEYGLKYIQKKLQINTVDTISVGDMPNDLPLFNVSGLKVAMGNADETLKKAADVVAPQLKDDGVAWVVEKYLSSG